MNQLSFLANYTRLIFFKKKHDLFRILVTKLFFMAIISSSPYTSKKKKNSIAYFVWYLNVIQIRGIFGSVRTSTKKLKTYLDIEFGAFNVYTTNNKLPATPRKYASSTINSSTRVRDLLDYRTAGHGLM